ncbi:MAG: putative phosphotransferase, partial [Solirubrobacterales bacterium]|nr:putative phosphotransferase [Solirubrobacterales bacterium]
ALRARATAAVAARWPGARIDGVEVLHGGVSSLTFAATLSGALEESDRKVVVKVAPPGLEPVRNRDVLRQARVLRALTGAPDVRVPEVLVEDAGSPPFFIMSFVAGDAYEPLKDVDDRPPSPVVVDARARAAARMLAALQRLDPVAIGLADERVVSVADELERWATLFATVPEELHHGQGELLEALRATVPEPLAPRVLHGDYRVGNMQFVGGRVAAIIDWEIWSVGDPRTDLGWLLVWSDPVQKFHLQRDEPNTEAGAGMPSAAALLDEYRQVHTIALPDMNWFAGYCRYKMASTTAVLVKQSRHRPDPDPRLETAATTLAAIVARGLSDLRAGA